MKMLILTKYYYLEYRIMFCYKFKMYENDQYLLLIQH